MGRKGFTLVEIMVALVILAVGILGISSSAGRIGLVSATVERDAVALQSVEDRLAMVLLHPNYAKLDSLFSKTESNTPSSGLQRVTQVVRNQTTGPGGKIIDYTDIIVTVSGSVLSAPISRTQTVGAP